MPQGRLLQHEEVLRLTGVVVVGRMYGRGCSSALGIFSNQGQEKEENKQSHKPPNKQKKKSASVIPVGGSLGFTLTGV